MRREGSFFAAKAGRMARRRQARTEPRTRRIVGMEAQGTGMALGAYPYTIDRA
jgi:hypothetical protein